MECVDVESRLSALLDGELEDVRGIEEHLGACELCRRKRLFLATVQGAVRRLPVETVSDSFVSAFRRRLDAERGLQRTRRRPVARRPVLLAGALAAALLLGLWASTQLSSRPHPISPASVGVTTPEGSPGLDCGLRLPEARTGEERPCASAASCGPMRVLPDSLSRRPTVCIEG